MNALISILTGIALLLDGYTVWNGRAGRSLPGCGVGSSCNDVTRGRWSKIGNARVAVVGLLVYGVMFASTILAHTERFPLTGLSTAVLLTTSIMSLGAAIWFTFLQAIVIRKWCVWCLATHAFASSAAILVMREQLTAGSSALPMLIAAIGLISLIAGQLLIRPKLYAVIGDNRGSTRSEPTSKDPSAQLQSRPVPASPESTPEGATCTPEQIEVFADGRVKFDIHRWPILGRRDAKHLLVDLFDYTCHHCRAMRAHLERIRAKYPDDIALIMVPTPMEMKCNPLLNSQDPRHRGACDYAKLALALWKVDSGHYEAFDRWLFDAASPPTFERARAKAESMVDAEKLTTMLTSDEVSRLIADGISIYAAGGAGPLPQLLLRKSKFMGEPPPFEIVCRVLEQQLGLNGTPPSAGASANPAPQAMPQHATPPGVYVMKIDRDQFGGNL